MRRTHQFLGGVAVVSLLMLACGPATPTAPPAAPAAQAKPVAPAQPKAEQTPKTPPAKTAAETKRLIFGTSSLGSAMGIYTAAVVNMLNKQVADANLTLAEHGSIVNNLQRVRGGQADIAAGDHTIQLLAYKGLLLKGWENSPQTDLRLLWLFNTTGLAYVVSERAAITRLADLGGKPFSPGGQGTSAELITQVAFDLLSIKPQYFRGGLSELVPALRDRRIVGYVKGTPLRNPDPTILETQTAVPVRLLNWPSDVVEKVRAAHPYFKTIRIPAGVYDAPWNKEPIQTWATPVSVFTTAKLPEELAYHFTRSVLRDRTEQAAAYPEVKDEDMGKLTVEQGVVPLHKGALKALQEAGYQVPKELIPSEAG